MGILMSCLRDCPRSLDDSPTPGLSPSSSVSKSSSSRPPFKRWSSSTTSFFHQSPPLPTIVLNDDTGEPLPVGRKLEGLFGVGDGDDEDTGVAMADYFSMTFVDSRTPIPPRASSLYSDRRLSRSWDMLHLYTPDPSLRRRPSQHWRRSIVSADAQSVVSMPHQRLYALNPDEVYTRCVSVRAAELTRRSCEELGPASTFED